MQTLISSLILVLILQQLIFWKAPFFLKIFNPREALLENATIHLRTVSWGGLPFITIILIVAGVLQGLEMLNTYANCFYNEFIKCGI